MTGLFTEGELSTDPGSIRDYQVGSGEYAGASFNRQWDTNPLNLWVREMGFALEELDSPFIDQGEAQAEVTRNGLDIKIPKRGVTRYELDGLQELKRRERDQFKVLSRPASTMTMAGGFAAGIAAGALDPINVASSFIPIVPEVRYAQWLAQAGEGAFARAAVRAGAGAIEGVGGAALIEPIVYGGATSQQLDYGLMDSFLNVTLGGALGGGLHVAGGAFHDWASLPVSDALAREAVVNAPDHVKRDAMQAAVQALERGEPVDVQHILDAWHGSPHTFERFDLGKIGEGEGKQAFGEGLYFAQSRAVGEHYRDALSKPYTKIFGRDFDHHMYMGDPRRVAANTVTQYKGDVDAAIAHLEAEAAQPSAARQVGEALDYLKETNRGAFEYVDAKPNLYQVAIKAHLDELMDWEKTIPEQPAVVQKALKKLEQETGVPIPKEYRGEDVIRLLAERPKDAGIESFLNANGVKGLHYLDGMSRDDGEGTRNFVIFNDQHVEIVSRNGQPVGGRQPGQPRGLADLIPEAKADRTEAAFNRQFGDQVEEIATAEKAKPKDRIEAAKTDGQDWGEIVEQFREQGRVTEADDAALKQADELGAWAERRARAFEAAASCLTVA